MEQSTHGATAARSWFLLLSLATTAGVLRVRGQSTGFVSIDCGLSEQSGYVDDVTKLPYSSDAAFTNAGSNHNVSAEHVKPSSIKRYLSVRSFPDTGTASRSCYTFPSIVPGSKCLLRATFMYGNYDGLNKLPVLDLYLDVNFWKTVNISKADSVHTAEVIAVIPSDTVQVCLVDIGLGTPFISGLDLRPLKNTLYPQVNSSQGLVLLDRSNFGASDLIVRHPDDPYDREWFPWSNLTKWRVISTKEKVRLRPEDAADVHFDAPSVVMQTAITPLNASQKINFSWDAEPNYVYPTPRYTSVLYFSELEPLPRNAMRMFSVTINGMLLTSRYTPQYLFSYAFYGIEHSYSSRYDFTIQATTTSLTLPPTINAAEFFSVISTAKLGTDAQDVSAINAIKTKYQVKKNWVSDPCAPKTFAWDGLNCSYPTSSSPRITSINMSFGGLSGDISSYFANFKAMQHLDLSYNKLTGSIPYALAQLPSLVELDLTGNQLSGSIPFELLKRKADGSLTLRYNNNPKLCDQENSCQSTEKKNSTVTIYIAALVVAGVVIGLLLLLLLLGVIKNKALVKRHGKPENEADDLQSHSKNSDGCGLLQLDNRWFTYLELGIITNNFQRVIGRGGFGVVYDGFLEDGTRVAVKLRSQSSNQGVEEFLTEARNLTKIHHKNLVSLIGYCKDGDYLALVYEHMPEGNLQDKLRGGDGNIGCLTWKQRLCIALESAQGLEYLHNACSPPFLHRDVKTSNILLNGNLKAKVADFGLLKAFNNDDDTHVSTARVVGTYGYLAPEYASAMQLTKKSDVYSFGVVLLEVITGRPPILQTPEPTNIIEWAGQRLEQGNIEDVVDMHMHGDYDVNSVWKTADVALRCTAQVPTQRPTMTAVVAHLEECLDLEGSRFAGDINGNLNSSSSGGESNTSYNYYGADHYTDISPSNNTLDMGHNFGSGVATSPATR
ncbi:hypothetical protein ZWY2020_044425 [Hordeum vulgare]|nr:hypothetical protein ZWY2020_044425 [Hordeum vulgare]